MELFGLDGKTAIITGATRGIGRAIALRMAEAGANVIVSSRKAEACAATAEEIRAAGGRALAVACNVSHLERHEALVTATLEAFGGIDIFVGNAAANPHYGPTTEVEERAFDKIFDTNVKANLWLCKRILPLMAARKGGAVILISSIASLGGNDDIGIYGASKAAANSLARSLALGWGKDHIRVNVIAPGLIKTDFASALWQDAATRRRIEETTPLGRIGAPDDIAGVAVMLAADAGRYITGQVIVVDGGMSMASARVK